MYYGGPKLLPNFFQKKTVKGPRFPKTLAEKVVTIDYEGDEGPPLKRIWNLSDLA